MFTVDALGLIDRKTKYKRSEQAVLERRTSSLSSLHVLKDMFIYEKFEKKKPSRLKNDNKEKMYPYDILQLFLTDQYPLCYH